METAAYVSEPSLRSFPPHTDEDGEYPAYVVVNPWGDETESHVILFLEVDEAESLARRLLDIALAAKRGVYTDTVDEGFGP